MEKFFLFFFLNILFLLLHNKIAAHYNIYDAPDDIRKKHKNIVALTGGLIIYVNLFFILLFDNSFVINFIFLSLCFLLGYFDDRFNLNANKKLLSLSLIITINLFLNENLIIQVLKFEFMEYINLNNSIQFLFTTLCILIFVNAFNMFDGSNLQASLYSIFIFTNFYIKSNNDFYLFVLLGLVTFSILNGKNKSFLGDAGSLLLGYLISIRFIEEYNANNLFYCEEIFIIMFLPGIEMLRLFIIRVYNKKNPLKADNQHLHHILKNKINEKWALTIILFITLIPFLLSNIIEKLYSIFFGILIYIVIINFLGRCEIKR